MDMDLNEDSTLADVCFAMCVYGVTRFSVVYCDGEHRGFMSVGDTVYSESGDCLESALLHTLYMVEKAWTDARGCAA
jgi:hypothetical protein